MRQTATVALCASIFQSSISQTLVALLACAAKIDSIWALYRITEGGGMCVSLMAKLVLTLTAPGLPVAPNLQVSFL